jgi:ribosome-associated toxin RatA of RatAB toxin-antitoxin module
MPHLSKSKIKTCSAAALVELVQEIKSYPAVT